MPTRTARTAWNGTLQEGSGQVELTSSGAGTFDVSFPKRAAEDADGTTSPEELIAAAHSSCFAMQLSAVIAEAGGTPVSLEVSADVTLRPDPAGGFRISGDRADGPRGGRGARRRRLPDRGRDREGHLPGEQGPDRHGDHAGRLARLTPHPQRPTRWRPDPHRSDVAHAGSLRPTPVAALASRRSDVCAGSIPR